MHVTRIKWIATFCCIKLWSYHVNNVNANCLASSIKVVELPYKSWIEWIDRNSSQFWANHCDFCLFLVIRKLSCLSIKIDISQLIDKFRFWIFWAPQVFGGWFQYYSQLAAQANLVLSLRSTSRVLRVEFCLKTLAKRQQLSKNLPHIGGKTESFQIIICICLQ